MCGASDVWCTGCELLRKGGPALHSVILKFINRCWENEVIPETWRCRTIISLYKAGTPEEPGNYRGITVLSVFRKLFGTLLTLRLQNNVNLHESQAAFRNGRGCIGHIYTFARIVRAAARKHGPLYAFFLDIRKAYDTVWRDGLMFKLLKKGVTGRLGRVVSQPLLKSQSRVRFEHHTPPYFPISLGVGQGDPLSIFLFDVCIDDLLEELHTRPAQHCIEMEGQNDKCIAELPYAGDVNAMSLTPHGLQGHIDVVDSWLHGWRLSPNVTKSKTMIFNPAPGHPESAFTMRGVQLQAVQTFKYLGVHFHQDCTWTEHVQYVRGRMNKALGMWRPVLQCHYLTASVRIGLAYTFVYTHALYGAEAWAAPRNELDKMDAICKAALRLVFGLHQFACHAEILFADCGLLPVSALISAAKLCWKVRLTTCLLSVSPWPSIPSQSQGKPTLRARKVKTSMLTSTLSAMIYIISME